jgi:hypothetical protein
MLHGQNSSRISVTVGDEVRLGLLAGHVQSYHHGQSWRLLAPPVTMVSLFWYLERAAVGSGQWSEEKSVPS